MLTGPAGSDPTTPGPVTEGTVLDGRYRLDELIGRGGTAEVYRGTDELLQRFVAIKVFDVRLTDLNTVVRQRNEMQVLARLTHPHLIAVYDARIADTAQQGSGTGPGRTYLVLELVDGGTLADLIARGPLSPEQSGWVGLTLASVLQTVHGQGMVHRDIKPANVLLDGSGGIKLGDFGLARILQAEDRPTTGADIMGTAAYFSPEQARAGEVGPPADIYSLGLVLLECLTGRKEFPGEAVSAAVARLLRDPVIPPDLPAPWPGLLTAMTARDPIDRPTADQVRSTLAGSPTVADRSTDSPPRPSSGPVDGGAETVSWSSPMTPFLVQAADDRRPRSPHRRRLALTGAGAVVALVAATLWSIAPGDTDAPAATPTVPVLTGTATTAVPTVPKPTSVPRSSASRITPQSPPRTVAVTVVRSAAPSTSAATSMSTATSTSTASSTTTPTTSAGRPAPVSGPTTRTTVKDNGKGKGNGKPPKTHGK